MSFLDVVKSVPGVTETETLRLVVSFPKHNSKPKFDDVALLSYSFCNNINWQQIKKQISIDGPLAFITKDDPLAFIAKIEDVSLMIDLLQALNTTLHFDIFDEIQISHGQMLL